MRTAPLRITQESFDRLVPSAASGVFWELDPESAERVRRRGEERFEKEAWLSSVLLDAPGCGFYLWEDRPLATLFYCSPAQAPGARQLPTAPASADATLITSLYTAPGWEGMGMEAVLIDAAIMDVMRQGDALAVEAFGWRDEGDGRLPGDREPRDGEAERIVARAPEIGLLSASALEAAGFSTVREHPLLPRLRLELPPQRELLVEWEAQPLRHPLDELARVHA
ncbi:hypothetical protein [Corynebacterium mastitidis]|uniref:hypothetical protein n=1 Tax=Corynebacterium mastitidis TaxID=161890 RepID=UPI000378D9E9|nr:hypothetical protein [Corynebacterium mastitidis]